MDQIKLFDVIMKGVLNFEGEYVNDSQDPGGETKYGVSKKAYPELDIPNLTEDRARSIYFRDYFVGPKISLLPTSLAIVTTDMAINMGVRRTVKLLQSILEVKADGVIGPKTLDAAFKADPISASFLLTSVRILAYSSMDHYDRFKQGWIIRAMSIQEVATRIHYER